MMVTGDHPTTATAIARSVGILGLETPVQTISLASVPSTSLQAGVVSGETGVITVNIGPVKLHLQNHDFV